MASHPSHSTIDPRHQPFIQLSTEARELYVEKELDRIEPRSSLEFYRDYIARNKPVIITDAIHDWPALSKWTRPGYLRQKLANETVTIDRVPVSADGKGYGDSVVNGLFITPHEEQMKFPDFLDQLEKKDKSPDEGILYCQHQNSSLTEEFSSLCEDVPELSWATNAFNASPDAVNIWIGEDRSISTLHHDPYENLYAVVTGTKYFLLSPPSDYHWLDKREYPKAKWVYDPSAAPSDDASFSSSVGPPVATANARFSVLPDPNGDRTAWFNLEPQGEGGCIDSPSTSSPTPTLRLSPNSTVPMPASGPFPPYSSCPPMSTELRSQYSTPIWVELHAGEVLYLPSLWFHRVAQKGDETGKTIAVNFWYDMQYDSRYTNFRFLEQISNGIRDSTLVDSAVKSVLDSTTHVAVASCTSSSIASPTRSGMKFLFLSGPPAAGKLTIARELSSKLGWRLAHNHLVVDVALSIYDFGTPGFISLREQIWWSIVRRAMMDQLPGLIFTFNPENSVPQRFIDEVFTEVTAKGGEMIHIELTLSETEIERRMNSASRQQFKKLVDVEFYKKLRDAGIFRTPVMPEPLLRVDTERLQPDEAAAAILAVVLKQTSK